MPLKKSPLFIEALFLVLWSSGFIASKSGLPYAGTFTLLFWRYLLLSAVLLAWLAMRGQLRFGGRRRVGAAAGMGILGHAVWLSAAVSAAEYGVSPGVIALVAALQPLVTGVVAGPVLGERVAYTQWIGLLLGFVGVALVVGDRIGGHTAAPWWAYFLPLISALSLTAATVWQRKLEINAAGFLSVPQNLAVQCWASAVVLLPFAWGVEHFAAEWSAHFIFILGWLTFIVSLSAYGLLIYLFKRRPAPYVAALLYLTPPMVMLMDYFVFGAMVTIFGLIGLMIAVVGVYLSRRKPTSS